MSGPDTSPEARKGLANFGRGVFSSGMSLAATAMTERLLRDRRTAEALDLEEDVANLIEHHPDAVYTVVASDGIPLHVEVDEPRRQPDGDGPYPTIVFSHGYCLNQRCWIFQRRTLREAGYRVVLWDQRGHGKSGNGDRSHYTIDRLGDDLARVITEVVPDGPIVLVGHSMGGMTMMCLALDHPELVKDRVIGAGFVATSPGGLSDISFGLGAGLGRVVHLVKRPTVTTLARGQGIVDKTVLATRDVVDFFVDRGSFGSPVPLAIAQLTTDMIFGTRMDVISGFMPHFDNHDKKEALAGYAGIESLVINGTADRLTPPHHSAEIVRVLPHAEHVVISKGGHVLMLEFPDVLNEQLLELIHRAQRAAQVGHAEARGNARRTVTDMAYHRRKETQAKLRRHGGSRAARRPDKADQADRPDSQDRADWSGRPDEANLLRG